MPGIGGVTISPLINLGARRSGLSAYKSKMDFWAEGINGIETVNKVGSETAKLKEFPAILINDDGTAFYTSIAAGTNLNMTENKVYEYNFIIVISATSASYRYVWKNGAGNDSNPGTQLRIYNKGFYLTLGDGAARQNISQTAGNYFQVGLNVMKITFNLPTKAISFDINGNTYSTTHSLSGNILGSGSNAFALSNNLAGSGLKEKFVYLNFKKEGTVINEYIFDRKGAYIYDQMGGIDLFVSNIFTEDSTQDLVNPYVNGYDIYVHRENVFGIDYKIVPRGLNGQITNPFDTALYEHFAGVNKNQFGLYTCNYVELPDLPIFDTTSRTYWKSSIESDPYYVGGTAGKERWFHISWLNYAWINAHIETSYLYLFFSVSTIKSSDSTDDVNFITKDLVLFNEVINYAQLNRDINNVVNLQDVYFFFYPDMATRTFVHSIDDELIALEGNLLKYSSDHGQTFNAGYDISTLHTIGLYCYSKILSNGNICVFFADKVFYSTDNCTSFTECTYLDKNGDPFVFHTPVNSDYPGGYFYWMNGFIENNGVVVLGNYTNSALGSSPVIMWYSLDGQTWQEFYMFGQNSLHTDDGTAGGGTGGTLFGDVSNPILARHVHGVNIGDNGKIYACAGDSEGNGIYEMHFLECEYDSNNDTWTVNDLLDNSLNTSGSQQYRAIGVFEKDGYLIWGNDGSGFPGIFKCSIININDPTKIELIQSLDTSCYTFVNYGQYLFAGLQTGTKVYMSNDFGETWSEYEISETNTAVGFYTAFFNEKYKYIGAQFNNMIGVEEVII